MAKIAIIGSGFSGLSAAAHLAKEGHQVTVFEKNEQVGGRARQLKTDSGYLFDMGPSWYWMPEVFEKFFRDFGYRVEDFYQLTRLDPAFSVVYGKEDVLHVPDAPDALHQLFESVEPGSSRQLDLFMKEAAYKYNTGMGDLVYKPGLSLLEFANAKLIKGMFRLQVFSSFSKHVAKFFRHPKLRALMEFPVLFLGAMPQDTPALYSLMNYAGLMLGTWYPMGGFGKIIEAMLTVNRRLGVQFETNAGVEKILCQNGKACGVLVNGVEWSFDAVISSADYHHTEQQLLPESSRNYPADYWDKKVFAPSCLIYYLGVRQKVDKLQHHTLFFDESLYDHSVDIYRKPKWPAKPLFYVCCPSKTDPDVAPEGHENLFLLMPLAPGLEDTEELRERYFHVMMNRLEDYTGTDIRSHLDEKRSYGIKNFMSDYNSYKGNAYGLANTLMQTAILKPSIKNRKIDSLYYTGQLTVPGPGVPPALISGEVAARLLNQQLRKSTHEKSI